jgi:hypothetical protein
MSASPFQLPTPRSIELDKDCVTPPPKREDTPSPHKMLKIDSLLNPSGTEHRMIREATASLPPTPAYTQVSATSTPQPSNPPTPALRRQKLVKDNAVFHRGVPKDPVRYLPYELGSDAACLTDAEKDELARQHQRFQIFPNGSAEQGLIRDYQRHIPYSSEKKDFYGKTNMEGFHGTSSTPLHPPYQ